MKEHPILFKSEMVNAILEGRKTQTRRIIKNDLKVCDSCFNAGVPHNGNDAVFGGPCYLKVAACDHNGFSGDRLRPKYDVGDLLYGRENIYYNLENDNFYYSADNKGVGQENYVFLMANTREGIKTIPNIHMFKKAARLWLKVKSIRVERVQDISEEDARTEGLTCLTKDDGGTFKFGIPDHDGLPGNDDDGWHWSEWEVEARNAFKKLWDRINASRGYSWESNPWVWVVEFEKIEKPERK